MNLKGTTPVNIQGQRGKKREGELLWIGVRWNKQDDSGNVAFILFKDAVTYDMKFETIWGHPLIKIKTFGILVIFSVSFKSGFLF